MARPSEPTEAFIRRWHAIGAPNAPARRLMAELEDTIGAFARLRRPADLAGVPGDLATSLRCHAEAPEPARPASPRDDALAGIGLAGQRRALRAGEVRSADLLEAAFAAVDARDPVLNAVLWQDRAGARQYAAAADRRFAEGGALPPLHGVPLAHKDLFAEAGRPQTAGSDFWRDHRAELTATVIARLAAAGAFSWGGLHMADFAQNPTGHNAAFGDCINPWRSEAIAGGSSSGSAVAVAAGYTAAALGTDTGGSIRLPAACCGVTGLKPTYGRISRFGVAPLSASLDCVGPIARTALDCAILLDAVAGADPADPTCADRPSYAEAALDGDARGQRIGVPDNGFLDEAAFEVRAAYHRALDALRQRGATLVSLPIPLLDAIATYGGTVARVEAACLHAEWMRAAPDRFAPHVAARLYPGYAIPATYYIEAMQRRPFIVEAFCAEVFDRVDAIATPTLRSRVPTRAKTDMDRGPPHTEQRFFAVGSNVRPFNYLGLPALTVPVGFDAAGVPIGLQLVGRPFGEARLLRIADAYQRDVGAPPLPPR